MSNYKIEFTNEFPSAIEEKMRQDLVTYESNHVKLNGRY